MAKTRKLALRIEEEELEHYRRTAQLMGMSVSEYARMLLKSGNAALLVQDENERDLAFVKLGRYLMAKKEWEDST